jgi:lipid-binding SYLF domain-containing protein
MKAQKEMGVLWRTLQMALTGLMLLMAVFVLTFPRMTFAATAREIDRDVTNALTKLYQTTPAAKKLSGIAKGILVFPSIIKGGFIVGGEYGEGALRVGGKTTGYYNTVSASYGLQVGAQSFGYALFFLSQNDLKYLEKSDGWEIGIDHNIVLVDKGLARSLSTTTAKSGVYAFFFNQKGLMADLSIAGSKITKITPGK